MLLLRVSLVAAAVIANVYRAVESPLMEGGSEDMEVSDRGRDRGREAMLVQQLMHRINQFIVKKLGGDYKDIEEAKKHESLGNDHVMNMLRVMMYSAKKFLPYDPPKGMGAGMRKKNMKLKGGKCVVKQDGNGMKQMCKKGTGLKCKCPGNNCKKGKCVCPDNKPIWDATKGAEK